MLFVIILKWLNGAQIASFCVFCYVKFLPSNDVFNSRKESTASRWIKIDLINFLTGIYGIWWNIYDMIVPSHYLALCSLPLPSDPVMVTECDVPFPGIPVPGIFSLFLMVSEPVSEKFGTEKSLGISIKKIWYRKMSQNRSRKNLVPEKSLGTGIGKYWYWN